MILKLINWYQKNHRKLPWRETQDPYKIWISEVMLQQTRVAAVIPYYTRFIQSFSTVYNLAQASEQEVIKNWAGLGYYSRARNLHAAAKQIAASGFPQTYQELLKLKGFGPYTSRAVSSFAFGQKVGVVDGNVIRVISRLKATHHAWWTPKVKEQYQQIMDAWVKEHGPLVNQAIMELGAMICTPTSPKCQLCPIVTDCRAKKIKQTHLFPAKKPKRKEEIWIWQPEIYWKNKKLLLIETATTPFLKKHWLPPGKTTLEKIAPKKFAFKHSITHHQIFVKPIIKKTIAPKGKWVSLTNYSQTNPSSLIRKLLEHLTEWK